MSHSLPELFFRFVSSSGGLSPPPSRYNGNAELFFRLRSFLVIFSLRADVQPVYPGNAVFFSSMVFWIGDNHLGRPLSQKSEVFTCCNRFVRVAVSVTFSFLIAFPLSDAPVLRQDGLHPPQSSELLIFSY